MPKIHHYYAVYIFNRSFLGKIKNDAPIDRKEVDKFCDTVKMASNLSLADSLDLSNLLCATADEFIKKFPDTLADGISVHLGVGSSIDSLELIVKAYMCFETGLRPSNDEKIETVTDLYKQEYQQNVADKDNKLHAYLRKYGFAEEKDHRKVRVRFGGQSVVKEMWEVPQMERELREIDPNRGLLISEVNDEQQCNVEAK